MTNRSRRVSSRTIAIASVAILCALSLAPARAQGRQGALARPLPTPRAASPIDLTGYWVSVVSEDWRYRMVTPAKGDFQSVPLTPVAREVANNWDPGRDEAAGAQCKSYGAPALMRVPGRLRITWQDDITLRIETDAGTQTRLLRFGAAADPAAPRSWQGTSVAEWVMPRPRRGGGPPPQGGSLKAVTTRLSAGYLRKNGVPYSENAVLTEYFDVIRQANGERWLLVTSVLEDAIYLQQPFTTSTHFKAQADGSGWSPTPCSSTW
jgi:hypothetical protein